MNTDTHLQSYKNDIGDPDLTLSMELQNISQSGESHVLYCYGDDESTTYQIAFELPAILKLKSYINELYKDKSEPADLKYRKIAAAWNVHFCAHGVHAPEAIFITHEASGCEIHDPYASSCGRFLVDPETEYGKVEFQEWKDAIDLMLARLS